MRNRAWSILAGALLATMTLLTPSSVSAADSCEATLVDETNGQVLDAAEIDSATKTLEALGADVRVRAFETAPLGSLDAYVNDMVSTCASWRGPDGLRKGNLIVFAFSMDRKSAILYGSNWSDELDDKIDKIRAEDMGDQFRSGNFTAGIVNSERAVISVINGDEGGGAAIASVIGKIFIGLAIALAFALLTFGLVIWRRHVKSSRKARLKAQKEAIALRDQAVGLAEALNALSSTVQLSSDVIRTDLNDEDAAQLDSMWEKANGSYGSFMNSYNLHSSLPTTYDPEQGRTTEQYSELTKFYGSLVETGKEAEEAHRAIDDFCTNLHRMIQTAPADLDKLRNRRSELGKILEQVRSQGFRSNREDTLRVIDGLITEASQEIGRQRHGQALDELQKAKSLCDEFETHLLGLQGHRDELVELHAASQNTHRAAMKKQEEVNLSIASLRDSFHASCWRKFPQSSEQASAELEQAKDLLARAEEATSMTVQDWDGAERLLSEASRLLSSCTHTQSTLLSQCTRVEAFPDSVPDALNSLESKLINARRDVNGFKGKQSGHNKSLESLGRVCEHLRSELSSERPPYSEIMSSIDTLRGKIEDILDKAKKEHRRKQEEEDDEDRRRRQRMNSSYGSSTYGAGLGTGYGIGSSFGGGSSGGGFGGGSSGSWGGSGGGGSSGSW